MARNYGSVLSRRTPLALLAAALILAGACAAEPAGARHVDLATTTSVHNAGLLDSISRSYTAERGVLLRFHVAGSGRALAMLADGTVDAVISHAPAAEAGALRSHPHWWYRKIMFNDFVIVGPTHDPAGVRAARTAPMAMRRIADSTSIFLSRGDESGTHERERALWAAAGAEPLRDRVVVAGQGMGATLRVASERRAYTLTDRATLAQLAGRLDLAILFEGGPDLVNTYAAVVNPGSPNGSDALEFGRWLADGRGRNVIDRFRRDSRPFRVWPPDRPRTSPADLP